MLCRLLEMMNQSDYLSEKKNDLQKNNKMAKKFIFIPKK